MGEPDEKPQPNVTTIYLTPEYKAKLAKSIEKHGVETASATIRVLIDNDQDPDEG